MAQVNAEFGLCKTYPRFMMTPKSVSDDDLVAVAEFRSKQRLPSLSWVHPTTEVNDGPNHLGLWSREGIPAHLHATGPNHLGFPGGA